MKCFVTILLLLISLSFIAENIDLAQYKSSLFLMQEGDMERSADDELPTEKNEEIKVKCVFANTLNLRSLGLSKKLHTSTLYLQLSSGYINRPYTPPNQI